MNCVVIDDEPLALQIIEKYIAAFPSLQLSATFDDALAGARFLQKNKVDLLITDINMPDISGLELVSELTEKPLIIFTTAHKKFAIDGFELEAVDYLLKPITFERFEKAVRKAEERFAFKTHQHAAPDSIVVRSEYKMIRVVLADIEFIEAMEDYIKIHLLNAKHPVLTLMSLKGILEMLPENRFSRIHRSYIIPSDKVHSIQNKRVQLFSGKELPISESYISFIDRWKQG